MSDWTAFASGFATATAIVFTIEIIRALLRRRRKRHLELIEKEWRTLLNAIDRLENRR